MNPIAQEKLAQRRRRLRSVRRRVAAVSAAVFIAVFGTIYVQMAAGRDPALNPSSTTAQVQATDTPEATVQETDPAPVTTSQS